MNAITAPAPEAKASKKNPIPKLKPNGPVKPTPGPWIVDPIDLTEVLAAGGTRPVATTYQGPSKTREERHANARLIAAAPDMLAALEGVRDFVASLTIEHVAGIVDAAITKARGRREDAV